MKILLMIHVKRFYVKYFNGFSLKGEETLFSEYLYHSRYCVAGFSYGAQKALEYTLDTSDRIDRLILLSPAFFQSQKPSFIRAQLRYFESNKEVYVSQFLKNVSYPSTLDISPYLAIGTVEELESLLSYEWQREKIDRLLKRGVTIEVFLGQKDKIVQCDQAQTFFTHTTNYILKDAGHLLRN